MTVSRRKFLRHGAFAAAATCASSSLLGWNGPLAGEDEATIKTHPKVPRMPMARNTDWHNHANALQALTKESFAGVVGSTFRVYDRSGSSPSWLTLLSVNDLSALPPVNPASFAVMNKKATSGPTTSGFVLHFNGSAPAPLAQDTFLLQHSELGQFALFLVPANNGQQLYVAVVNRLGGTLHSQYPLISTPVTDAPVAAAGFGGGQRQQRSQTSGTAAPVGATMRPATTSSGSGNLSPDLSETRVLQTGPAQD